MNLTYACSTAAILLLGLSACAPESTLTPPGGGDIDTPREPPAFVCEIPTNQIVDGGPGKDGIPALTNPATVSAEAATYLAETDRVIGLMLDGQPTAVPHNVLWWHEIVNYDAQNERLAITYCPLTGSSIVFDRAAVGGAELGVSGLLYNNNLIMYDRNETEALWSQMLTGAGCESSKDVSLASVAHVEMTWAGWKALHPATKVLSSNTGFSRNYQRYPYGSYEEETNGQLLFRQPAFSELRPPKERVLGIPGATGGALAFPFGMLAEEGPLAAVEQQFEGRPVLVLWDESKRAAAAFRNNIQDGQAVQLSVVNGQFVDAETGSAWTVDGRAVSGPLAGQRLEPIREAYVAFWFAWATFHSDVEVFG